MSNQDIGVKNHVSETHVSESLICASTSDALQPLLPIRLFRKHSRSCNNSSPGFGLNIPSIKRFIQDSPDYFSLGYTPAMGQLLYFARLISRDINLRTLHVAELYINDSPARFSVFPQRLVPNSSTNGAPADARCACNGLDYGCSFS